MSGRDGSESRGARVSDWARMYDRSYRIVISTISIMLKSRGSTVLQRTVQVFLYNYNSD